MNNACRSIWWTLLAAGLLSGSALGQEPSGSRGAQPSGVVKLTIATRHVPPFAIKSEDGEWSGISIDLLREVIGEMATEGNARKVELQFRDMPLAEMLRAVERGEVDLAAAAITVNREREERMDFSHAFHVAGLGIAAKGDTRGGWQVVLERVFSVTFLQILSGLAGLSLLSGLLIHLAERRVNEEQFGGGFYRGVGSGVWWSLVTLTTVGYGDKSPKTAVGRGLAVFWMLSGLLIISSFTASVASALTIGQLTQLIEGPDDLGRVRVATVEDSTSQLYLGRRQIGHQTFAELTPALEALDRGEVDAVVYDAPMLRYQVIRDFPAIRVLDATFERQQYALAMPSDSPLREAVNRAVLGVTGRTSWEDRLTDYLGEN